MIHSPPTTAKRYHIDDLLVYVDRSKHTFPLIRSGANCAQNVFGDLPETLAPGQRAFDLSDLVRVDSRVI